MSQRIIKFRFFINGKLLGTAELNRKTQIVDVPYDWDEVSQFTGLFDKNGKEIWEGDICAWVNAKKFKEIAEVRFSDGQFFPHRITDYRQYLESSIEFFDSCEVLGNIYENSELLNGN